VSNAMTEFNMDIDYDVYTETEPEYGHWLYLDF
jgi:hypothetical protein